MHSTMAQSNRFICGKLTLSSGFLSCARKAFGRFFADSPDDGLHQMIDALFLSGSHLMETEFRLALGTFANTYGQRAAKIIFDIGGFVARFLGIPGVNTQSREVARLRLPDCAFPPRDIADVHRNRR